jgi:hypothetical protein
LPTGTSPAPASLPPPPRPHWLQERHGVEGLFDRLHALAVNYQKNERGEYEDSDRTRVLFRVLLGLRTGKQPGETVTISPGDVATSMNNLASAESLAEEGKTFTSPRKVGWLLKRQRFKRPEDRSEKGKLWEATRQEIEQSARAYGVDVPGDEDERPPF